MNTKLKTILVEAIREEAAMDYLKYLVDNSPYKNKVYYCGGIVRDNLMNVTPKDIDIVVDGDANSGIDFATWATKFMGNYKEAANPVIFPKFFTSKFTLKGIVYNGIDLSDVEIEAVAPRTEKYTDGSRKPEVEVGNLKDDSLRRDLTINSLFQNVSTGEVLDLTGKGQEDLKNKLARTPLNPDITFSDDPLRMLRVCRQSTKYDWDIPLYILRSVKKNAAKINNISSERISDELSKMLVNTKPEKALKLLKITGLLGYIIPEFKLAYKLGQNSFHRFDVFQHSIEVLKHTKPDLITRLMGLLHDIGKTKTKTIVDGNVHFFSHEHVGADMAKEILTRLKFPNHIIDAVVLGIKNHMRLKQSGEEGEKVTDKALRKIIVDFGDNLESILNLMDSDNKGHAHGHQTPNQIPNIIKRIDSLKNTTPVKGQKLPVSGEDLKALGLQAGPLFKELLDLVKDRQLEAPNTTKEQYLDMIKDYLKSKC